MGKTISIKVLFGIYLLLMAGKVFAFSCNVDGGSSIGAGTTSVYVNLDPVIQAFELGMNGIPRCKGPLSRELRRRLGGTHGVVIVDEADHLDIAALEELRLLQESTRIGLVLMGNHHLYTNMTGGSKTVEFARLFSRIAKRTAIKAPKVNDVKAIAEAWDVTAKKEQEFLLEIAQKPGAIRTMTYTLRLAAMNAYGKGKRVNEDYLREAYEELDQDVDVQEQLGIRRAKS